MKSFFILGVLLSATLSEATKVSSNFAYEDRRLAEKHIGTFSAIAFGNASSAPKTYQGPKCKVQPDNPDWPSDSLWTRLNTSLNGRLLKPRPVGSACYPSQSNYNNATCAYLLGNATTTRFFLDDPLTSLVTWGQGGTCLQLLNTTGRTCDEKGFPAYVVNASTVQDIQAAVNFARNQNLRLVIKNTGHDFVAKSTGGGSLSVWTHFLKDLEFLPSYTVGEYTGPAAKIGAGVETWEAHNAMVKANNVTIAISADPTVGIGGGWTLGGGHGLLTSLHGLGADQVLSFNVVTADGHFLTASPEQNQDLYYALRGGGGSTFGIVTSIVVKAWPERTFIGGLTYYFTTGPNHANITIPGDRGYPATPPVHIPDTEIFWKAVRTYLGFAETIVNAGGFGFGDPLPQGNNTYLFASTIAIPRTSAEETKTLIKPLFEAYRALGINITTSPETKSVPYATPGTGITSVSYPGPIDRMFISRLLPRTLWLEAEAGNSTRLDLVAAANRRSVEQGSRVTLRAYAPTAKAAGYPGSINSAVNPSMRNMVIHCVTFSSQPVILLDKKGLLEAHAKHSASGVADLRRLTPESGAYFNEADRLEPNFQRSFWGENYPRLLRVKREVDPWGLFWAGRTVGSEGWEVRPGVEDGEMPTQDGRLCRVGG